MLNVALRPTLDKDNSKAYYSTPRGRNNWFAGFSIGFTDDLQNGFY